jgi:hypothetical protein
MRKLFGMWVVLVAAPCCGACGDSSDDGADSGPADTDADAGAIEDAGEDTGGDPDCPNPAVADEGTGLDWLSCHATQCVVDGTCAWPTGEAEAMSYDEALAACPTGSRLAAIGELMGLLGNCDEIDLTTNDTGSCDACPMSAACNAIYPGIDALGDYVYDILIWSSDEMNDAKAWSVNLKTGNVSAKTKESNLTALCVGE